MKEFIKKSCQDAKSEVELVKAVEQLQKEYDIVENSAYFETKKQQQQQALQRAEQLVMQAQQQGDQEFVEDALLDDKM